jgi:hypothetical protein
VWYTSADFEEAYADWKSALQECGTPLLIFWGDICRLEVGVTPLLVFWEIYADWKSTLRLC